LVEAGKREEEDERAEVEGKGVCKGELDMLVCYQAYDMSEYFSDSALLRHDINTIPTIYLPLGVDAGRCYVEGGIPNGGKEYDVCRSSIYVHSLGLVYELHIRMMSVKSVTCVIGAQSRV